MNVFRILGDLSHLLAMFLLLIKIWRSKSCAGEQRPGGTGRDQGGNLGSAGTARARASKNLGEVVPHQRIRELCGSVISASTDINTAPPSPHPSPPSWQCHCYWTKTGGGGTTLPLTRREERIFRKCPSGGVFPLPSTPQGGPSVSCMLVTPAWRRGVELALSGDRSYLEGLPVWPEFWLPCCLTGVGRSFQAG